MRIIPSKTNVDTEIFKGFSIMDMIVAACGVLFTVLLFLANIPYNVWIAFFMAAFSGLLMVNMDDEKTYMLFYNILKYFVRPKSYSKSPKKGEGAIADLTPFTKIENDLIDYAGKYSGAVIEIPPVEFRFFNERKQNYMIDRVFGGIIRTVAGQQGASLIKVDRPMIYDNYIKTELQKIEDMKKAFTNGLITQVELDDRVAIINTRIDVLKKLNGQNRVIKAFYYLAFFEKDKEILEEMVSNAVSRFHENDIEAKRLNTKELAVFLKYNFTYDFDEREIDNIAPENYIDWVMPDKIEFASRTMKYDDKIFYNMKITNYPGTVANAWGHQLFNIPNTKVTMKLRPVERYKSIKIIDRSIDELRSQESKTGKTSKLIEIAEHIKTLANLLRLLQGDNESLFEVNIYITIYDKVQSDEVKRILDELKASGVDPSKASKKVTPPSANKTTAKKYVKRLLTENNFRAKELMLQQFDGYASGQVSRFQFFNKKGREIHSSSIAAVFPFVYSSIADEGGVNIGNSGGVPVFIDFFKRNSERVNSNMVIIGKSGSGKSYSAKTILCNLAAEDSKIFILDPENEYCGIAKKMHGKLIDVGSATQGRLNPFHIITSLSDDDDFSVDDDAESDAPKKTRNTSSFSVHLQFLEEFFRQILPGVNDDAMEFLNNILLRTYQENGIDAATDLTKLEATDYPTFDNLYEKILADFQSAVGDYSKNNLRVLLNHISKFATGGRNSNLWNGESTISTNENFIVFNFQSLLANKNGTIANAQMLLVLKWLDNEIIKNRDYNLKYKANRHIIVVIDEAHVFIDEKYPIALDFMFQLAKRIRKYSGMQIIITQNVRDFVGTEEIARKSMAIINACQYSMILPLAPSDMADLCKLYEKAGQINEVEQEQIINNGRGRAFVIMSPTARTTIKVDPPPGVEELFN